MRALRNCDIEYFLCLFHVMQAWERFVKSAESGVAHKGVRKALLADIRFLAKTADKAAFGIVENSFKTRSVCTHDGLATRQLGCWRYLQIAVEVRHKSKGS